MKEQLFDIEKAFSRLEDIVQKLESGDISLDDSLKAYEEGMDIVKNCTKKLDEAELRVKRLIESGDGKLNVEPIQ